MNPKLRYSCVVYAVVRMVSVIAFLTVCFYASAQSGEPGTLLSTESEIQGYTNIVGVSARSNVLFLRSSSRVSGPGFSAVSNVAAVAAGYTHNLALLLDGTVRQFGPTNIPPVPSDLTNAIAVAAGEDFSCALRSDGTVTAWGRRFVRATNVPPALGNIVAIAAGRDHVIALTQSGDVIAWGSNSFGQTNVPPAATNIAFIAAVGANSVAATSDGIVWRWGEGQTVPVRTNLGRSIRQVTATRAHTFALDQAGNLIQPPAARIPWNVTNLAGIFGSDSNLYAIARGPVLRSQRIPPEYPPEISRGGGGLDSVAFAVKAESFHPFAYHWFFNGTPLSGATNSLVRLTGLRATNSGTYFAMVSNIYGTMTSAPVTIDISLVCDEGPAQAAAIEESPISAAVTPQLVVTGGGANEGSVVGVTARLSQPASNSVSFDWTTSDGTALAGRDYYAATGQVVFPPGSTNEYFQVRLRSNPYNQSNRTFYILLTNFVGTVAAETRLTCTIFDNAPIITPPGFTHSQVAWVVPNGNATSMDFAPDGRIFVCNQYGRIHVIKPGMSFPLAQPFATLGGQFFGEAGVLGIALDPGFQSNSFVYVFYTLPSPDFHNRISRFTAAGDVVDPCSEKILVEIESLRGKLNHLGGALHFGPDGKLYAGLGDQGGNWEYALFAQSLNSLVGKILRINTDGTIPEDNPFYSVTSGPYRAIWAVGLRNPFTFAIDRTTGRMLINNVGARWEEVNEGFPGANFGWPYEEGPAETNVFTNPVHAYPTGEIPFTTNCAVIGAAIYNPPRRLLPADYLGSYFFGDHCSGWIRRLDTNGVVHNFISRLPGLVDIDVGPDGALYTLTLGGFIRRFAAPSMFLSAQRLPDQRVQLFCAGAPNEIHILEASNDLANWQPIATNQSALVDFEFYDPAPTNSSQRFYRLRR